MKIFTPGSRRFLCAPASADSLAGRSIFDFTWWNLAFLADDALAEAATRAAARADLLLVSVHPSADLSPRAVVWMETWPERRRKRTGALVVLMQASDRDERHVSTKHMYFRELARRANMDYLPQVILPRSEAEMLSERVHRRSALLDEILQRSAPAPRWSCYE